MLATCLHGLQGTPYVYQGEELGMRNVRFPSIEDYRDIETLNHWRVAVQERGEDPAAVLASVHAKSRDNARTPMPWHDGPGAGFGTGTPWIALNPDWPRINAAQAVADPDSVFHHYRRLIALRREEPALVHGRYRLLLPEHPQLYVYLREAGERRLLVACNFSGEIPRLELPADVSLEGATLLLGNHPPLPGDPQATGEGARHLRALGSPPVAIGVGCGS